MIQKLFSKCPCKLIQNPPRIGSQGQFTIVAVVALVVLRLAVGFHFFSEGANKLVDGEFSAVGFLQGAKGPFAGWFQSYLKDPDGLERLNYNPHTERWDKIEVKQTTYVWSVHRERVAAHYQYGPRQTQMAQHVSQIYDSRLQQFFIENNEDINEYFRDLERVKAYRNDPQREDVDSRRGQTDKIERDYRGKRGGWLKQINTMWLEYDRALNAVATDEQKKNAGLAPSLKLPGSAGSYYAFVDPNAPDPRNQIAVRDNSKFMDVDCINSLIPRMDLWIGVLLILGLFTRLTSIVAALFLGSIMLTQWPWSPDTLPIHYQAIEAFALVILAVVGAGRFCGLDFFIVNWRQCCGGSKSTENETSGDTK